MIQSFDFSGGGGILNLLFAASVSLIPTMKAEAILPLFTLFGFFILCTLQHTLCLIAFLGHKNLYTTLLVYFLGMTIVGGKVVMGGSKLAAVLRAFCARS